jgi:hypothetical protein
MSKKLEKNGLWESSRMMLPQHREAFIARQKEQHLPIMPDLHDDEFELIIRHIKESFYTHKPITVEWFRETKREYITGNVDAFDEQQQRVKIVHADSFTWIMIARISQVRNQSPAS